MTVRLVVMVESANQALPFKCYGRALNCVRDDKHGCYDDVKQHLIHHHKPHCHVEAAETFHPVKSLNFVRDGNILLEFRQIKLCFLMFFFVVHVLQDALDCAAVDGVVQCFVHLLFSQAQHI